MRATEVANTDVLPVEDVVNNYKAFDIPLEVVWNDIDYMFQYRDFTNDPNTFPVGPGKAFIEGLAAKGQHYIPIVDSALYRPNPANASDNYTIYDDGASRGVFLMNPDGSEYIGSVWPGYTVRHSEANTCFDLRCSLT